MSGARHTGAVPAEMHLASARSMLELLEQEGQALQTGDYAKLATVCRDKARTVAQLSSLLDVSPRSLPAELRSSLLQLVKLCQQRTKLNESLLAARAQRSRRTLQALSADTAQYDRRGMAQYRVPANAGRVRGFA